MTRPLILAGLTALALSACQGTTGGADVARLVEPPLTRAAGTPPPGSDPAACWGRHVTPATVETVTEHILLQPAQIGSDGTVLAPPIYKTETQQRIVEERREIWFETPCEVEMDAGFIASLQRALAARGIYQGPVTGRYDPATRHAVRAFQVAGGLDSAILSLAAARKLGLVAYPEPAPRG